MEEYSESEQSDSEQSDCDFIIVDQLTLYKKPYKNYNVPKLIKLPKGHDFELRGEMSVVYVDRSELSYHNMETIIDDDDKVIEFKLDPVAKLGDGVFKLGSCVWGQSNKEYFLDSETGYRGGRKYMIRSKSMATELTRKLRKVLPGELLVDFLHVNNVFRINEFKAGDAEFKSHYDTPFVSKDKISKYTILIYDTSCNGPGLLNINGLIIDSIICGDVYIFDQRLIHSGKAPSYGIKKFIRSELLYRNRNEDFNPDCAKLFNIACYFSKEVNFREYSSDLFNKTMQKRITPKLEVDIKYLLKSCRGVNFITNGNDYYFRKEIKLTDIAIVIIVDYFNAKKRLEEIEIEEIPKLDLGLITLEEFNLEIYTKQNMIKYEDAKFDYYIGGCPFNEHECYITDHSPDYRPEFESAKHKLSAQLIDKSVCLFGKEIYINEKMIVITKDYIAFEGIYLDPLNFASCQCDLNVPVYNKINCLDSYNVPPIKYELMDNYWKLSIDLFNNGFTYGFTYDDTVFFDQPYTEETSPYHYNSDPIDPIDPRILVPIIKIKSEISNFIQSDVAGLIAEYASEYRPCYKKEQVKSVSTYTYNECNGEIILYMKSCTAPTLSYCPVFKTFIDKKTKTISIAE